VALIGGIAITVQGQLMAVMDKYVGTLESVFIPYQNSPQIIPNLLNLWFDTVLPSLYTSSQKTQSPILL